MNPIPSDVNNTIWRIAERGDPQAAKEFIEKHPAHAQEMNDRMNMVGGMKQMRAAVAPSMVPPFKPKYMGKPKPKWRKYGPVGFGIAALAAASFYVAQNLSTPLPDIKTAPVPANAPRTGPRPDPFALPVAPSTDDIDADAPRATLGTSFKDSANGSNLQEITMNQVPFHRALRDIASHWHLIVDIPPKTPDPVISHFDAFGKNGMEFLKQLAGQQGYSVYERGRGHVLVLPEGQEPPDTN